MDSPTLGALSEISDFDPNRLVIDGSAGSLTYGQLESDVDRLAGWMADRVGRTSAVIAVRTADVRVAMTGFLAIEHCGCISVPLDPSAPLDRARFIADDVDAALILTDDVTFFDGDERASDFEQALADGRPFGQAVEMADDAISSIIFTSGSTGLPKGTVIDWRRNRSEIERFQRANAANDRLCLPFAGTISNSVTMMARCVALGRTLVPYDVKSRGVQGLGEFLREQHIGTYATVPTLLRVLLDAAGPHDSWPDLKHVVTWGEGLTWHDVDRLRPRLAPDARITARYGVTEAGAITTYHITADTPLGDGLVPAGRPDGSAVIRVVDADGNEVRDGEDGEIVVIGDGVGVEYWRRPDLSERVFRTLPDGRRACWTRDRGRMLPDGNLQHLGRLDHMVKISGNRVDLGEVEVTLRKMQGVGEAGVIAQADVAGDTRLIAFVTAGAEPIVPAELRSRLLRTLPGYMIPDTITVIDHMPTLPNGKVDRRALTELRLATAPPSAIPQTGDRLEASLVSIWSEVLGCAVDAHDTLAELGADSIRCARAFALIEKRLGYDRPISLLLEAPTAAELAVRLRASEEVWHPLVPVRTAGPRAPLFVVHGGGGDVMFAVTLARYLDAEIPVYGLQSSTLSGRIIGELDPESLARQYVTAIRAVQPNGPYFLFGYSLGGLIAFEMACQLEAAGQQLALLGIGDVAAPGVSARSRRSSTQRAPLTPRNLPSRALRSARSRLRRRRREMTQRANRRRMERCVASGRAVPPHLRKDFSMWQLGEHHRAYRPLRVTSSPTLLVQTDSSAGVTAEAWSTFITGPIQTVLIPGTHVDLIHQPTIEELGAALNARISPILADVR